MDVEVEVDVDVDVDVLVDVVVVLVDVEVDVEVFVEVLVVWRPAGRVVVVVFFVRSPGSVLSVGPNGVRGVVAVRKRPGSGVSWS